MFYRITAEAPAWDRASIAAAMLVGGEMAFAWMLVIHPVRLGTGVVAIGTALAIGSVVVLGRCRLPTPVKAALMLGLTASVLACMATQDAVGAKALRTETDATLADAAVHANDRVHVRAVPGAGSGGDRAAHALQGELEQRRITGGAAVALSPVDPAATPDRPLRLNWALDRGDDHRWCGEYTVEDRARPDMALLADRVQDAVARSRDGPLTCD